MSKSGYYGDKSGKARKIKKIYDGLGGVARKVKRAYVGVDGKARLWYSAESPPIITDMATNCPASMDSATYQNVKFYGAVSTEDLPVEYRLSSITGGVSFSKTQSIAENENVRITMPTVTANKAASFVYSAYSASGLLGGSKTHLMTVKSVAKPIENWKWIFAWRQQLTWYQDVLGGTYEYNGGVHYILNPDKGVEVVIPACTLEISVYDTPGLEGRSMSGKIANKATGVGYGSLTYTSAMNIICFFVSLKRIKD